MKIELQNGPKLRIGPKRKEIEIFCQGISQMPHTICPHRMAQRTRLISYDSYDMRHILKLNKVETLVENRKITQ